MNTPFFSHTHTHTHTHTRHTHSNRPLDVKDWFKKSIDDWASVQNTLQQQTGQANEYQQQQEDDSENMHSSSDDNNVSTKKLLPTTAAEIELASIAAQEKHLLAMKNYDRSNDITAADDNDDNDNNNRNSNNIDMISISNVNTNTIPAALNNINNNNNDNNNDNTSNNGINNNNNNNENNDVNKPPTTSEELLFIAQCIVIACCCWWTLDIILGPDARPPTGNIFALVVFYLTAIVAGMVASRIGVTPIALMLLTGVFISNIPQ